MDNPQYYPTRSDRRVGRALHQGSILIPERYVGAVMKLCLERRGVNSQMHYPTPGRVEITFDMPLAEVIFDFYDS